MRVSSSYVTDFDAHLWRIKKKIVEKIISTVYVYTALHKDKTYFDEEHPVVRNIN